MLPVYHDGMNSTEQETHRLQHLQTYLNDHLAGSVGALEMLDRLVETLAQKPLGLYLAGLRQEIEQEQRILKGLLDSLAAPESVLRKAGAWMAEKASRLKLRLSGSDEDQMGLFLALEGLILGVTGKAALWRALECAAQDYPALRGPDYSALRACALEQAERVDQHRLEVARAVFQVN